MMHPDQIARESQQMSKGQPSSAGVASNVGGSSELNMDDAARNLWKQLGLEPGTNLIFGIRAE